MFNDIKLSRDYLEKLSSLPLGTRDLRALFYVMALDAVKQARGRLLFARLIVDCGQNRFCLANI